MTVSDLALQIAQHRADYYRGKPTITDDAYDAMEALLKKTDPNHPLLKTVGAPASNTLKKVKHRRKIGSLDNAFEADEITAWVQKVQNLTSGRANWVVVQPKMDGLTIEVQYHKGVLVTAATRGDGDEGEDVTASALAARGIPRTLPVAVDIDVRSEAMITTKRFEAHFKALDYKNPRNAAAGTMRNSDTTLARHIVLYAFSAEVNDPAVNSLFSTEEQTIETLRHWGFNTVPYAKLPLQSPAIIAAWEKALEDRDGLAYGVDGCVVKINKRSLQEECGWSATCPVGCRALKWRGQQVAVTEVVGLLNSVGHTGIITPVAILKPVAIGGTTTQKASLMNWDEVDRIASASLATCGVGKNTIGVGAMVKIERAGDVIPRVIEVVKACAPKNAFARPDECPTCGTATIVDGPRQRCPNADCPAQVFRKILHWVKGRNILHLGESTLDALMNPLSPYVQNIADIYRLDRKQIAQANGSFANADRIMVEIEKSKDCTLSQLFGNIGIPGIGETEAEKVAFTLKAKTVADMIGATRADYMRILGPSTGQKFEAGCRTYAKVIAALDTLLRVAAPKPKTVGAGTKAWNGKTFCITGSTSLPRAAITKIIEEAGGTAKSTVVNGLDFLITNDTDSGSKKNKEAAKKGVRVINEITAMSMAGHD